MSVNQNDIERYHRGLLSAAERHALEKKALSDPFLAEALEGAESISAEEFSADLEKLSKRITKKGARSWITPLRIAAGMAILIGSGSLFYYLSSNEQSTLATMESSAVADSSTAQTPLEKDSLPATQALAMTKDLKNEAVPSIQPSVSMNSGAGSQNTITTEGETIESDREAQLAEAKSRSFAAKEEKSQVTPLEISDDKTEIITKPSEVISASEIGLERKKDRARSSSPIQTIHGKVTSSDDRSPLPGVNVIVKATGEGVVTDAKGNYTLLTELQNPQLVFSFIGRQTQEARANGTSPLDIEMIEDVTQLSEVVVTDMSLEKTTRDESLQPPVVKMAAPLGGMRAYNKYLENSLKYPKDALEKKIKGKVTVRFTVTTTGSLTEFSVIKGLGYGCDEEVIRVVKEGPRWTPTTQDDVAVESEVKVKMKFDPEKVRDK